MVNNIIYKNFSISKQCFSTFGLKKKFRDKYFRKKLPAKNFRGSGGMSSTLGLKVNGGSKKTDQLGCIYHWYINASSPVCCVILYTDHLVSNKFEYVCAMSAQCCFNSNVQPQPILCTSLL